MESRSNGSHIRVRICILWPGDVVPHRSDRILMGRSSEDPSTFVLVSPLT
jgi:hypothetical protein